MKRRGRSQLRLLSLALAVILCSFGWLSSDTTMAQEEPPCDFECDFGGDDERDAIVASGSIMLPASGLPNPPSLPAVAADCPGCEWRLTPRCRTSDPFGNDLCLGARVGCPPDHVKYRVLLRRPPAATFSQVGEICLGGGSLQTVVSLGQAVRDRLIERLPRQGPSYQPPNGALVNLPTIFAVGQPPGIGPESLSLLGFDIVLTADAGWTWTFEPGVSQAFDVPGGRYPNQDVTYTYEQPGPRSVSVTTTWTGEFTADGLGPFPVAGPPVTQTADLALDVREARARLVAD